MEKHLRCGRSYKMVKNHMCPCDVWEAVGISWVPKSPGGVTPLPPCPGWSPGFRLISSFPCPRSSSERGDPPTSPDFLISLLIPPHRKAVVPPRPEAVWRASELPESQRRGDQMLAGRQDSGSCSEALPCGWVKLAQVTELLDHGVPANEFCQSLGLGVRS